MRSKQSEWSRSANLCGLKQGMPIPLYVDLARKQVQREQIIIIPSRLLWGSSPWDVRSGVPTSASVMRSKHDNSQISAIARIAHCALTGQPHNWTSGLVDLDGCSGRILSARHDGNELSKYRRGTGETQDKPITQAKLSVQALLAEDMYDSSI